MLEASRSTGGAISTGALRQAKELIQTVDLATMEESAEGLAEEIAEVKSKIDKEVYRRWRLDPKE